jgi:hypothetical protein
MNDRLPRILLAGLLMTSLIACDKSGGPTAIDCDEWLYDCQFDANGEFSLCVNECNSKAKYKSSCNYDGLFECLDSATAACERHACFGKSCNPDDLSEFTDEEFSDWAVDSMFWLFCLWDCGETRHVDLGECARVHMTCGL